MSLTYQIPRWLHRTCVTYVIEGFRRPEPRLLEMLDRRETARREKYAVEADRDGFTLGALLLRSAVAQLTGVSPAEVPVDRTCERCGRQHGPPRLPGTTLHASVSHSGDVVAVAVTGAGPVGVDVELLDSGGQLRTYDVLSPSQERPFLAGPMDFYVYWTRKEAVLKSTGEGMERDMSEVIVSAPSTAPALLSAAGGSAPACRMADIRGPRYAGAVAVLTTERVQFLFADAPTTLRSM